MADETISTSINELSSIAIAEARLVLANRQDLKNICDQRMVPVGSESVRYPKYANQTATSQTEGADIANSEVTTTGVVLTPTIAAGWSTVLSDLAAHNAPQIMADLGRLAADAIIKKRNADIFALFDGFSTSLSSTGTDLTVAIVKQGVKKLMQANAMGMPYLVITPEVWEDLWADLANTSGANSLVSDNTRDRILGGAIDPSIKIHGATPVVVTSGISESGDVKCGLLTDRALGYAYAWDIKVEFQRRSKAVGWDVTASAAYAVGEVEDTFGVEIICDGAD